MVFIFIDYWYFFFFVDYKILMVLLFMIDCELLGSSDILIKLYIIYDVVLISF